MILSHFDGKTKPDKVAAWVEWTLIQLNESPVKSGTEVAIETELTAATSTDAEDIPMPTQPVETQTELVARLDTATITSAATTTTPQNAKIDQLLDAIHQLVGVQTALLQSQINPPAISARAIKPKPTPLDLQPSTSSQAIQTSKADGEETSSPRQRAGAAETSDRINRAIDAIMNFNNAPDRKHTEKWAIGINTLKAFAKSQEAIVAAISGKNRKGELLQGTRQSEIESYHKAHNLDPEKHNYVHRGKRKIVEVIQLAEPMPQADIHE